MTMNLTVITNLWPPFTARELDITAPYVPTLHYHEITGPSKKRTKLIGPSKKQYELVGSQTVHELQGSH